MSNVTYTFDGAMGIGTLPDGTRFLFDAEKYDRIRGIKWYRNYRQPGRKKLYIIDRRGNYLHRVLTACPPGYEVDHISLDTLDNRSCNLRIVTHQQNQINHSLQRNNSSGVSGVDFYSKNDKFRARIKVSQQEIHLGYYDHFCEAVQARNVGMECMFGEFGRYNDTPEAPEWIRRNVMERCRRFADLSVGGAFCDMKGNANGKTADTRITF